MSKIEAWKSRLPFKTSITIYLEIFRAIRNTLNNIESPRNISLKYVRDVSRQLYIFPDAITCQTSLYSIHSTILIFLFVIFWGTIAINLSTCFDNVIAFGENMMFTLAVSMILFKIIVVVLEWKKIDLIVSTFIEMNQRLASLKNQGILDIQRTFFIGENGMYLVFNVVGVFLFATLCMQPIFTDQSTPLPALFPFNLHDSQQHPWGSKLVYGFQALAIFYGVLVLVAMDSLALCAVTQTAANLRILSLRLRELGINASKNQKPTKNLWADLRELVELHQQIICLVDTINDAFYFAYLLQMFSSTFMLGTASFEALLSLNDIIVAFKFIFFMLTAALQLVYWCLIGNIAYFDSQEVAVAGFDVHEWFAQSPALQRNLMFLIQRAQKPLQFCARPFLPFTMETFTKIIKVSYTAFTVLSNNFE